MLSAPDGAAVRRRKTRHGFALRLGALLLGLCLTGATQANAAGKGQGFYVIANMVNTPEMVDWAVEQGANAVKIDILVDVDHATFWGDDEWRARVGMNTRVDYLRDVDACDCLSDPKSSTCRQYESADEACTRTRTPIAAMLKKVARTKAVKGVIFSIWNTDEYVPDRSSFFYKFLSNKRKLLPTSVVNDLVADIKTELLDEGFDGWVDLAFDKREAYENTGGNYSLRWFFFSVIARKIGKDPIGLSFPVNATVNSDPDNFFSRLQDIYKSGPFTAVDFGYGHPVQSPPRALIERLSDAGERREYDRTYSYADAESEMEELIDKAGVDGIVTNEPKALRAVADDLGVTLAK